MKVKVENIQDEDEASGAAATEDREMSAVTSIYVQTVVTRQTTGKYYDITSNIPIRRQTADNADRERR